MSTKEYKIKENIYYGVSDNGLYDADKNLAYKAYEEQIKYKSNKGELSVRIHEGETGIGPSGIGGNAYTWIGIYHKKPMELLAEKVKNRLGFASDDKSSGKCKFSQEFRCTKQTLFENLDKMMSDTRPEIKQLVSNAYDLIVTKGRPSRFNDLREMQEQQQIEKIIRQTRLIDQTK